MTPVAPDASVPSIAQALLDPEIWALIATINAALALLAAGLASVHALLTKRDSRAAWGWIATCWLFPLAGPTLYYLFGINRLQPQPLPNAPTAPGLDPLAITPVCERSMAEQVRVGQRLTGLLPVPGNRIDVLHNGEEAYPAMLRAIADARCSIRVCTYIFKVGASADRFIAALATAQARGVDVLVLVDGMAELLFAGRIRQRLRKLNVPTARFLKPGLFPPMLRLNTRIHRKLLIIDDRVAFTGGMNIRDRQMLKPPRPDSTSDLHFRLSGPVVAPLAAIFARDWQFTTGEALPDAVPAEAAGGSACRPVTTGPNEDLEKLTVLLIAAIGSAHRRVLIMTPYFIPTLSLLAVLEAAALRGVAVDIVLPARSDQRYVDRASRRFQQALLLRGAAIWLQPAPFAHGKLFIVDDHYLLLGSANLDQRSLRLNFELVVEVFDPAVVAQLALHVVDIRRRSLRVDAAELRARSLPTRLLDGLCWLFSPYL